MNYLQIINKCLSELNFRQADSFDELIKPEHLSVVADQFVILIIGIFYFVAKLFHCPKVKEKLLIQ